MRKLFSTLMVALVALPLWAQTLGAKTETPWRIGVLVGYTSNAYKMSNHYQSDWQDESRGGFTVGITGQYDVNDWLGIRSEVQLTQKNYQRHRFLMTNRYGYTNSYLQVPIMANFTFGGKTVRGFVNAGIYGGYWMTSTVQVHSQNIMTYKNEDINQNDLIDTRRDNRLVFGYVGGAGVEYRFAPNWSAQLEVRYYYDVTSQVKQYQQIQDHRYNSTLAIQASASYHF